MTDKSYFMIAVAVLALSGGMTHTARADDDAKEFAAFKTAKISLYDAVGITEKKFPDLKIISAEFEMEDNKPAYTLEGVNSSGTTEITLDAQTGDILDDADGDNKDIDQN